MEQLGFNALLQLMIGVPLEMVHGILRISFLYLAGVLAGGCVPGVVGGVSRSVPVTSPGEGTGRCTPSLMGMWGFAHCPLGTTLHCQHHLPWGAMQPIIN